MEHFSIENVTFDRSAISVEASQVALIDFNFASVLVFDTNEYLPTVDISGNPNTTLIRQFSLDSTQFETFIQIVSPGHMIIDQIFVNHSDINIGFYLVGYDDPVSTGNITISNCILQHSTFHEILHPTFFQSLTLSNFTNLRSNIYTAFATPSYGVSISLHDCWFQDSFVPQLLSTSDLELTELVNFTIQNCWQPKPSAFTIIGLIQGFAYEGMQPRLTLKDFTVLDSDSTYKVCC
jgi:hypothetical protein